MESQPDVLVERRGPRVGAPAKALEGFLGSLGVDDYRLEEQDDKKGKVHVARFTRHGQPTGRGAGAAAGPGPDPPAVAQVDALGRPCGALGAPPSQHDLPVGRYGGAGGLRPGHGGRDHPWPPLPGAGADRGPRLRRLSRQAAQPPLSSSTAPSVSAVSLPGRTSWRTRPGCGCAMIRACWLSFAAWWNGRCRCSGGSRRGSWPCRRRCW